MRLRLTLRLRGGAEDAGALREALDAAARLAGFDEREAGRTVLAVHEALANVVRHGYGGCCEGRVVARVRAGPGRVEVILADACPPADPDRLRPRENAAHGAGGMGIPIMRKVLDVVEHRARPGRGNVLRLVRSREEDAC